MKVSNGTTILGIQCIDGVVLAADMRATTGSYIAIRDTNKITDISPNIYVCHSGSSSDTQALSSFAKYFQNVLQVNAEDHKKPQVSVIAQVMRKLIQGNKGRLLAQMIVGGYDESGPALFEVMQSGMAIKRQFATGGSGSLYISSYCDLYFKEGMTMEEATKFAIRAVNLAIIRDGMSGGPINIVQISAEGAKRHYVLPKDQPNDASIVRT